MANARPDLNEFDHKSSQHDDTSDSAENGDGDDLDFQSDAQTNKTSATTSLNTNSTDYVIVLNSVLETTSIQEEDKSSTTFYEKRSTKQKKRDFLEFFKPIITNINELTVQDCIEHCIWTKLSTSGSPKKLKSELKNFFKKYCKEIFQKMSWIPPHPNPQFTFQQYFQYFDYLVVIDFEATCYQDNPPEFRHEIIQFPAVLIDVQTRMVIDEFSIFCKPTLNPILSTFCTQLTGITQDLVDNALEFKEGLDLFEKWLTHHELGTRYRFAIVCDGAWDMGKFLHTQCEISEIPYPSYATRWVNIRKSFSNFYNVKWFNLRIMLGLIGQPFQGRPHDGLDDSRNIGNIVIRLLNDGCIIMENERILLGKEEQEKNAAVQQHERKLYSLCTVQNLNKSQFIKYYNWSVIPHELERYVNKENIVSTKVSGSINVGNGNRPSKKRGKPKFKKLSELKESIDAVTVVTTTSNSEILVVSARGLEE